MHVGAWSMSSRGWFDVKRCGCSSRYITSCESRFNQISVATIPKISDSGKLINDCRWLFVQIAKTYKINYFLWGGYALGEVVNTGFIYTAPCGSSHSIGI